MNKTKEKKGRNTTLEFLRLLAAGYIMLYHGSFYAINGCIAVEFFFLISGGFFLQSFDKEHVENVDNSWGGGTLYLA